jgi:hypothetical protein
MRVPLVNHKFQGFKYFHAESAVEPWGHTYNEQQDIDYVKELIWFDDNVYASL